MKVNSGNDIQAAQMGGDVVGAIGTATATSATSLTDSGATWVTNAYAGHLVAAAGVVGLVLSNTGTVLTVDQWSVPGTDAVGSTPGNVAYVLLTGNAPAAFVALSADAGVVSATDTTLPSEITTSAGGLKRKRCPYGHTAGVAGFTLTPVFTANGFDSLPVTIAKAANFQSPKPATGKPQFMALLGTTAVLGASGDQLTVTLTVTE